MNVLSRDQQIQVIGALTEGMSIRGIERMTGIHRDTIMRLGAKVGRGCAALHDRMMVGLRVGRLECDELWAFVGKKQRHLKRGDSAEKGDQYTFVGLASTSRAIISYRTSKRDTGNTQEFMQDLRERVLGSPEISTDGFTPYQPAVRDSFSNSAHGVIVKTVAVTDLRKDAAHRYSPAAVVAVAREAIQGVPAEIREPAIAVREPVEALVEEPEKSVDRPLPPTVLVAFAMRLEQQGAQRRRQRQ